MNSYTIHYLCEKTNSTQKIIKTSLLIIKKVRKKNLAKVCEKSSFETFMSYIKSKNLTF
jgi:hypothetical protein